MWLVCGHICTKISRRGHSFIPHRMASGAINSTPIKYLVFDIDDTLYPVTNGFTQHRLNEVALQYCVDRLGFKSALAADEFRRPYFEKYHSTLKALSVAGQEGALPLNEDGTARVFDGDDLSRYWAERCRFDEFLTKDERIIGALSSLAAVQGLTLVAFTNAPRMYGVRVLEALGVSHCFKDQHIFAVDDLLPLCKPMPESFTKVLELVGCRDPKEAVMFEDSMKNVRAAKAIGMRTVLIDAGETPSFGADSPDPSDASVDVALREAGDLRERLPCLWEKRWDPPSIQSKANTGSSLFE